MASPPTSSLRFIDFAGGPLPAPREWERCLIELDLKPDELQQTRVLRQGEPLRVLVQQLEGRPRVLAEWPLSGTGRYRLRLENDAAPPIESEITIEPRKISSEAYGRLIDDLQTELPASVALALQLTGALSGLELRPPGETTLAQELARLRQAVVGNDARAGLAATMTAIARDPHCVLRKQEEWVDRERVRRLEPLGLIAAVRQPNNLDPEFKLPLRAPDVRVEQTVDVYENRLLRSFHDEVAARLRQLAAALNAQDAYAPLVEVEKLANRLQQARFAAEFLDEVDRLEHVPTRVSMVLLKRRDYRWMLEGYLRFRRSAYVQLDEPALETPLENLPELYELWGTLQVIKALLEVGHVLGFETRNQRLAKHLDGGLYLKVLAGGQPAIDMRTPDTAVTLTPQRSYGTATDKRLRSISYTQIPDVTIEIRRRGEKPLLVLFDPKYKLQSEESGEPGDGRPKKIDIDTMHAYRDAIRTGADERVVSYAAILYPGPEVRYGDGIEALPARPLEPGALGVRLREVLTRELLDLPRPSAPASDEDAGSLTRAE
jgi:predicted component of viral defense system (DUF524 family)